MFFHKEKVTVREKEDVYQVYLTKERFALLRIYDVKDDVIYLKDKKQAVCLRLSFLEENGVNEDTTEENERKLIEALDQIGGVMKIYFLKEAKNTLQQNIEYWRQLAKAAKDPNYKEAIYERLYYLDYYCRGGRLAVITFHSLEDRIVKETFKRYGAADKVDKRIPLLPAQIEAKPYRLVTRKPIIPDLQEQEANNRAHSAKLRVIERIK